MDRWLGKEAIVTGASSGIGAAITTALVQNGLIVVGAARRLELIEENAKNLATEKGKLYPFKADIAKEEEVLELFQWTKSNLGSVDLLINKAGIVGNSSLAEGNYEDWKKVFDLNVLGLCLATKEAVKMMKENGIKGHIIHINSIAGHRILDFPSFSVYPASKFGVTALTEILRRELNHLKLKIKITSISPGLVESEMTNLKKNLSPAEAQFYESAPILKAGDVADAVLYAISTPEHVQIHELTIKPVGEPF